MHRSIFARLAMMAAALVLVAGAARPALAQDEKTPAFAQVLPKDAQVLVTWGAVADATGYTVSRRNAGEEIDKAVVVNATPVKETSLVDMNLKNGQALIYSIQAVFADGSKGEPAQASGTPHAALMLGGKPFQFYDIETTNPGGVAINGNVMTIRASGADIWDGEDGQTFLATPVSGDFTMSFQLNENPKIENDESSDFGKVGAQAKFSLMPDSPYALAFASVLRTPKYMFEGRRTQGGGEGNWSGGIVDEEEKIFPAILRLIRRGNVFSAEVSTDKGATFQRLMDNQTMEGAPAEMQVGIAATAHAADLYINGLIDVPSITLTTP
jgi:hypothetical protein